MPDAEAPTSCVFLTDETGTLQAWNDGCATLFGMAAGQVLGRPITTLFTPPGRDAWSAGWGALTRRPEGAKVHVDLLCAQGRVLDGTLTLAPQLDADGALRGCAVAVAAGHERNATEQERVARTPLSAIVDMFPGTFYVLNRDGRFVLWNRNLEKVTEMTPDELGATRALDLIELPHRAPLANGIRGVFDEGRELKLEIDFVSRSGRATPVLLCGTKIRCNGGDYLVGTGIDVAERRAHEQQLRLRERALHAAGNGIVITRLVRNQSLIEYVNPAFERITGYHADEVMGTDPRFMGAPGMDLAERARLRDAVAARTGAEVVLRNLRKNGELFWNDLSITPVQDEHGVATHYIGVITDVTATMLRTAHLEHEVNHDPLTGLANRNLLWDRLEHALHLAGRHKALVATVLIDLDDFKAVNDTFGHEAGDVVLKVVARRLQASVRDSDTVARMSGDEFVLVLANQPSLRFTLRMVERLRRSFAIPVAFNNREIPVGASVGVSLYPLDGTTAAELVRAADLAIEAPHRTGAARRARQRRTVPAVPAPRGRGQPPRGGLRGAAALAPPGPGRAAPCALPRRGRGKRRDRSHRPARARPGVRVRGPAARGGFRGRARDRQRVAPRIQPARFPRLPGRPPDAPPVAAAQPAARPARRWPDPQSRAGPRTGAGIAHAGRGPVDRRLRRRPVRPRLPAATGRLPGQAGAHDGAGAGRRRPGRRQEPDRHRAQLEHGSGGRGRRDAVPAGFPGGAWLRPDPGHLVQRAARGGSGAAHAGGTAAGVITLRS
ncbi:hypothetical protein Lal_00015005 [Lupinus albus]|nr:hypothetical protein Lal_00015005 [Lupinus albus]